MATIKWQVEEEQIRHRRLQRCYEQGKGEEGVSSASRRPLKGMDGLSEGWCPGNNASERLLNWAIIVQ